MPNLGVMIGLGQNNMTGTARSSRRTLQLIGTIACAVAIWAMPGMAMAEEAYDRGARAHAEGDFATAADIWMEEAQAGDPVAQFNLGLLYEKGEGFAHDNKAAERWYRRAAVKGIGAAQFNLAVLIVSEQPAEALFWLEVVAGGRVAPLDAMARDGIAQLVGRLPADAVEGARARAADWLKANPPADEAALVTLRRSVPLVALSDEQVKALQKSLAAAGYDAGPADGVIGRRTRKALSDWRQDSGLDPAVRRVPLELIE